MIQTKCLFLVVPMSAFEIVYWTCTIITVATFIICKIKGTNIFDIAEEHRNPLIIRAITGSVANILSRAAVLFWTNPIFTAYSLKEKISPYDWGAIIFMLLGILVMENPFAHNAAAEERSVALEAVELSQLSLEQSFSVML
jgi:hypothetical protein